MDIPIGPTTVLSPGGYVSALTARIVRPLPSHRLALRYTSHHLDHFTSVSSSSGHSSSDHSSSGHSISGLPHISTMYPPTTSESSASDSSFESSAGPSHKRCRDSISPEDSVEEDVDTDVLEDIKADATVNKVAVDKDVEAEVDASIGIEVDVGVDVEDEVEDEVESSDRVGALSAKDLRGGVLIDGERESLLKQVASLERSNARLQGTMMLERARADRFRRRISFMESELRKSTELVNRRWKKAVLAYEATRDANSFRGMKVISQNAVTVIMENGEMGNGRDGNGEQWKCGNVNPNEIIGGATPFARSVHTNHKRAHEVMAEVYCPRNEIQKMESELWNLETVKNNDLTAYTQRFQELTVMCTNMVHEEEDQVDKFIGGLPDNMQGNVIAAEPTRLQDVVRIANNLIDQKLKGYAVKNDENKRRFEFNQGRDNYGQHHHSKE
ncbi:putative reverse transcriptase domain-containing protein [Tanacetum coccineum]